MNKQQASWLELSDIIYDQLPKFYFDDYASFVLKRLRLDHKFFRILLGRGMALVLSILYFIRLKEELGRFHLKPLTVNYM
mgnify:CR=1 FL=1